MTSARIRELIKRGAQEWWPPTDEEIEALHAATFEGISDRSVLEDRIMVAAIRTADETNLRQWIKCNIEAPGERVPVYPGLEVVDIARRFLRRGQDDRSFDSYRRAQAVAWRQWMSRCFSLTDDKAELQELLDVTSRSMSTFIDETIQHVVATIAEDQPVTLVDLLMSDQQRAAEFAEDQLGALAHSAPELRETISTYVRTGCNASATAAELYTHRNTILRRLERADELLPRPLSDNVVNIAAALEILAAQRNKN